MSQQPQYMSREKLQALKEELIELKEKKIPALAKRIDDARQMGDLSENAEYHAAREDMAWAQSRVKELVYLIDNAEVTPGKSAGGVIGLGSTVAVRAGGTERTYVIVGAQEADPLQGRISNESPLGQAFFGKRAGDTVQVSAPAGTQTYDILRVH